MKKALSAILITMSALVFMANGASAQQGPPEDKGAQKVYVCKYVGTPGEDEILQTGNNPISVAVSAIPEYEGVGSYFADAQGRSYVLAEDNTVGGGQTGEPDISECPVPEGHPPVEDLCPNLDGDQEEIPDGMELDEDGNCVLPPPPPPPPVDVCPNIDGDQGSVPEGLVVDEDGDCIEPVEVIVDFCPNIEGVQAEMPVFWGIDDDGNCYQDPPVVPPTEPPVVTPPPVVVQAPTAVVVPRTAVRAPMAASSPAPAVLDSELAYTGPNDYLPALALTGFGLLMSGVFLTRKAARI